MNACVYSFDHHADDYDRWYDTPRGRVIFQREIACLRQACPTFAGSWLEIGAGTGRFSAELSISQGLEPAAAMRAIAAGRGLEVFDGQAETLPFADASFTGVLMVFTLCFVSDAQASLLEIWRVLRPSGTLLLGIVPAGSSWGMAGAAKAATGHPLYAFANFRSVVDTREMTQKAGFALQNTASTLFQPPEACLETNDLPIAGASEKAGFVVMNWQKPPA